MLAMLEDDGGDAVTMATKENVDDIRTGTILRTLRSMRARIYWGWVVTVASSIMFVVSYGFLYSFGIIMVDLMSEFDSSATDTGYIGTMAYGLSSLSCLVTVPLAVRVGYRFASMLGLISCVISCVVTSFAPDLSLMYFSHGVLYGIGASMLMTGGINITQSYFTGKHNSLAIGLSSAGANIGVLVMNPFVYTLSARFGWRTMFRIISATLVIVCVPAILTFAPVPLKNTEDVEAEKSEEKSLVLCKNSKMFVEVKDGKKNDKHTFERTCCEEETTSVCRSTGSRKNAKDDRTVPKSDGKSIGGHDPTLDRYSFRNQIRDEEQSNLLVADGTNTDIIPYHESNSILAVSSNHNCSNTSYNAPYVNGVSGPRFESSLDDGTHESDSRPTDTKSSTSNVAPEVQRNTYWRRLNRLLRMPDVWFLEIGMMTTAVALSFFIYSTANVIVTAGFSNKTASLVVAVMGFSEALGKIVIGLVADRLPIPKIFILMAANCVGALLMVIMSLVVPTEPYLFIHAIVQGFFVLASADSLPHSIGNQLFSPEFGVQIWAANMVFMGVGGILGAVFGESVDKTGSYNAAFYATIGISVVSTLCFGLCIVQQRFFARNRFFVFTNVGKRYAKIQRINDKSPEHYQNLTNCRGIILHSSQSLVVTECVSNV